MPTARIASTWLGTIGAVTGWWVAAHYPQQLDLVVLMDGPHPDVWGRQALRHPTQALRSNYVAFFQLPWVPEATLGSFDYAGLRDDAGKRQGRYVRTGGVGSLHGGVGAPRIADGDAQLLSCAAPASDRG